MWCKKLKIKFVTWLLKTEFPIAVSNQDVILFASTQDARLKTIGHDIGDCARWKEACQRNQLEVEGVVAFIEQDLNGTFWNESKKKSDSLKGTLIRTIKEQYEKKH